MPGLKKPLPFQKFGGKKPLNFKHRPFQQKKGWAKKFGKNYRKILDDAIYGTISWSSTFAAWLRIRIVSASISTEVLTADGRCC